MNEMAFPGNIVADRIPAMRQTFSPEKKQKKMVPCRISFQGAGDLREIYKRKRVSSRRSGGFFHVFQRKKVCSSVICLRRRSAGRFRGEKSPFKGRCLFPPLSNLKEMHALHTPSRIQKDFRETSERLQRDFRETSERLQRDFRDLFRREPGTRDFPRRPPSSILHPLRRALGPSPDAAPRFRFPAPP